MAVPGIPTGFQQTVRPSDDRRVLFVWVAPADDGGSAITNYNIQYRNRNAAVWSNLLQANVLTADLLNTTFFTAGGTPLIFRIAAINADGTGAYSPTIYANRLGSTTTNGTPAQVSAVEGYPGDTFIDLRWYHGYTNDTTKYHSHYTLEYKASSSGTWLTYGDILSPARHCRITGLTNGTAYDFRLTAKNLKGSAAVSATYTFTPSAITETVPPSGRLYFPTTSIGIGTPYLKSIHLDGTGYQTILAHTTSTTTHLIYSMATDGEWIYWTEDEGAPVYKVRPDGSGYTSTDPGLGILDGITVDDTYIYVFRNYTLWRMAKDFTGATIIANSGTKPIEHIQARGGYVYKLHAGAVDNWIDRSSDRGDTWTKLITLPAETIDIPTAFDVSDTGIRVSMGYGSIYTGWATYDLDGTNLQRILPNSRLSNTRNSAHLIGDTVYGFFGTDTKNLVRINRDGTQYRAITDVPTGGEPTDSLFVGTSVGDFTFIPSPAAVADFTGSSSDTGASLTWSAPTVPYGSAPITGYRIKYKLHSETEYGYSYDGEANALSWGISDLTPETEYDFSVSAISAAGVGEETVVMLTTGSEIPIFFNTTIMPA